MSLVDVDSDGDLDTFWGTGYLFGIGLLSPTYKLEESLPYAADTPFEVNVWASGDLDGDGQTELVVAGSAGVEILSVEGSPKQLVAKLTNNDDGIDSLPLSPYLAVGHFTRLDKQQVALEMTVQDYPDPVVTRLAIFEWTGGGLAEVATLNTSLYASRTTGSMVPGWVLGDWDADGLDDLAIPLSEGLGLVHFDGQALGVAQVLPSLTPDFGVAGIYRANYADLNGDGRLDVWAQVRGGAATWLQNESGGFTEVDAGIFPSFVADLDGDSAAEMFGERSFATHTATGFVVHPYGFPDEAQVRIRFAAVQDVDGDTLPDLIGVGE